MISVTHQPPRLAGADGIGLFGPSPGASALWGALSVASAAVSTYHGYKRNDGSIGWALAWGFLGTIFPVVTPAIAFAQGLGKRK